MSSTTGGENLRRVNIFTCGGCAIFYIVLFCRTWNLSTKTERKGFGVDVFIPNSWIDVTKFLRNYTVTNFPADFTKARIIDNTLLRKQVDNSFLLKKKNQQLQVLKLFMANIKDF